MIIAVKSFAKLPFTRNAKRSGVSQSPLMIDGIVHPNFGIIPTSAMQKVADGKFNSGSPINGRLRKANIKLRARASNLLHNKMRVEFFRSK